MDKKKWVKPVIEDKKIHPKYLFCVAYTENFKMGKYVDIGAFTYIQARSGVEIEDYVQIGSHCSIYSESSIDNKKGKVILKKNCKIGSHTVILPGVRIGENSVIGAHSFVKKDIPANSVAVGRPARVIKKIKGKEE